MHDREVVWPVERTTCFSTAISVCCCSHTCHLWLLLYPMLKRTVLKTVWDHPYHRTMYQQVEWRWWRGCRWCLKCKAVNPSSSQWFVLWKYPWSVKQWCRTHTRLCKVWKISWSYTMRWSKYHVWEDVAESTDTVCWRRPIYLISASV